MPRWASDVTMLRLNTGITVITVYRGKPITKQSFVVEVMVQGAGQSILQCLTSYLQVHTPLSPHTPLRSPTGEVEHH